MANVAIIALLIVIFVPVSSDAQTVSSCTGPAQNFRSFVAQKQEDPPMLVLNPGTNSGKPCKSLVAESVMEKPAWQLLEANKAVKIDLDKDGTIVRLEIARRSVPPPAAP